MGSWLGIGLGLVVFNSARLLLGFLILGIPNDFGNLIQCGLVFSSVLMPSLPE